MKTMKQNFLHRKLYVIVSLIFAFILSITCGLTTRKANAETAFSFDNFVMCEGAEVRTDGKNGIRFVASLGDVLPEYDNLTYNMMIVPKAYITKYNTEGALNDNWYEGLKAALEGDEAVANKTVVSMQTKPFYSDEVVAGEEGYYIRGTLSNVKYNNINIEWFGMAYITYDTVDAETGEKVKQYVYAQIPEENANVRSLVYCASGYLNVYDYSSEDKAVEKEILTDFVAQGINKASGGTFTEETKNDRTYLNGGIAAIQENAGKQANLLPEATESWTTGVPEGVKLHVLYGTEDNGYVSIDDNGVITGVLGDNNAQTTKNVTMKVLGTTYQKPVHVYTVTAELSGSVAEIFSKDGVIGDTTFVNEATLDATAIVDGVEVETLSWATANSEVATVENGVVTAVFKNAIFASENTEISFSFNVGGKTVTSNTYAMKVSFPVAYKTDPKEYGDLMQNVFNADSTALVATTEAINTTALGEDFGNVTNFLSADLTKELLVDGKTDANVYGVKEAGEKEFVVVSENGYAYAVKATVVSYAIDSVADLTYFFKSYETGATGNNASNVTYGTYVILTGDVIDFTRSDVVQNTSTESKYTYYRGTFDGRGHKITLTGSTYRQGFFGRYLGGNAVIKNVAIINIAKNSIAGGGLAYWMSATAVVDNCFIEVKLASGASNSSNINGIVYDANFGSITNTIVNVTASRTVNTSNLQTIGEIDTDNVKNCYSIGIENQVTHSIGDSTENLYYSADTLLADIVIDNQLPSGFNSYWTYTESGLNFGENQVLALSVAEE